ncbi:hypothetical protein N781_07175 [Pontibacillus halophilus JSM 076056 = DSM 19796]|uniref:DegV family protein n=1 Tax=Pontibacillus halophilus JSM 076056 = DSM 19796 TaxID=1385510 RepID=A0A0A5GF12_9BACI|nr:DegV family protein [Pontibacillus halophilus]KGX90564.1 hypothetical protein N781_07175 [Pontibacillus halophilus JSM 076056 = DSM 19796]
MHIQLMTDSGVDLPQHLIEKFELHIVPLNVIFGDDSYRAGVDLDLETFFEKMKASSELPKSSAPAPHTFYEAYKAVDPSKPILMLSLSEGLSSAYQNALMGKDMLLEEEPDRQIEVINTKTATCGMALMVQEAYTRIQEGYTFEDLTIHMEQRSEKVATLIVLKTLENLIKGGRLDRVKGALARTLNIKLLMHGSEEGKIELTEKVRGNKKAMRRFVDQVSEYSKNFEDKVIALSHGNNEERAKSLLQEFKDRYHFKDTILSDMGPLIATYAGEGGFVISFFKD